MLISHLTAGDAVAIGKQSFSSLENEHAACNKIQFMDYPSAFSTFCACKVCGKCQCNTEISAEGANQ